MRPYYLPPLLPTLALVVMPFLPFVNSGDLWFGLPPMLVWGGCWCVMLTPALLLSSRMMVRNREEAER
jgi:hypothetical protein